LIFFFSQSFLVTYLFPLPHSLLLKHCYFGFSPLTF
jgi:hypothetical protein